MTKAHDWPVYRPDGYSLPLQTSQGFCKALGLLNMEQGGSNFGFSLLIRSKALISCACLQPSVKRTQGDELEGPMPL